MKVPMRTFLAAGLVAAVAALFAGSAEAARFETVRSARNTIGIVVSGKIMPGDDRRFDRIARGVKDAVVILDSPGGDGMASLSIGITVRSRGFTTVVLPGADCASGCALIWLAGVRRFAHDTSAIGFYAAATSGRDGRLRLSREGNALVMEYLVALGYNRETARRLVSAPPESMFWLSHRTARQLGIETGRIRVPETPTTPSRRATGEWFRVDGSQR